MRQLWRNAGIWGFLALFGGISLLGPGWHCVVGHHFHGPAACHEHHHADACCAEHDHEHEHSGNESPGAGTTHDEHDCPLCRFFAQAQWTAADDPLEAEFVRFEVASCATGAARAELVGLYRSRAPPAGASSC